ncbi:MAG: DUF3298 domain-containing protein [Parcubacteria group bacterium]|nr:DUF3298 domain-containing protein [Parcubacteria group bacterium]
MKDVSVLLVALMLIVGGLFGIDAYLNPIVNGNTPAAVIEAISERQVYQEAEGYVIDVVYPFTRNGNVSKDIEEYMDAQVESFKAFASARESIEFPYELFIRTELYSFEPDIVSFKFTFSVDTGGPSPSQTVATRVYDFRSGELIAFDNIFIGASALESVASVVSAKLLARVDELGLSEGWALDGVEPVLANFENFVLSGTKIVFFFEPYKIAPYAEGVQAVSVSIDNLADVIRKDFLNRI